MKEVFIVEFEVISRKKTVARDHFEYQVRGQLVAKYEVLTPSLEDACYKKGANLVFKPNQVMKMVPLISIRAAVPITDGFSLLVDTVRLDFPYRYYRLSPTVIKNSFHTVTSLFEYESRVTSKVKHNLNAEHPKDYAFF